MSGAAKERVEFLERHLPGVSPSIRELRDQVDRLNTPRNRELLNSVLIRGETGTGKTRLASVIAGHWRWLVEWKQAGDDGSRDLDAYCGKFQVVHLPALQETLIESELFGHVKGAFTGADRDKKGILEGQFDHVLLDEIGDATPALQAKLLEVIDSRRFRRVGSNEALETTARLLFGTNKNLEALVESGQFREDLYWRINEYVIQLPALREQKDNIPHIARSIEASLTRDLPPLTQAALDEQASSLLTQEDLDWAAGHQWPGNIRELRHAVKGFLVANGARRLSEVAKDIERLTVLGKKDSELIGKFVERQLRAALAGDRRPFGTLQGLVQEVTAEVKAAVVRWNVTTKPSREQLADLFPENTHESIVTKLSQWKKREAK